jgi:hypothetical protein
MYFERKFPHKQLEKKKKGCLEIEHDASSEYIQYITICGDIKNENCCSVMRDKEGYITWDYLSYETNDMFSTSVLSILDKDKFIDGVSFYAVKNNKVLWSYNLDVKTLNIMKQHSSWCNKLRDYLEILSPPKNPIGPIVDCNGVELKIDDQFKLLVEKKINEIIIPAGTILTNLRGEYDEYLVRPSPYFYLHFKDDDGDVYLLLKYSEIEIVSDEIS